MTDSELDIVTAILKAGRTASVTTRTESGALHSRPLAIVEDDFAGTMWFFTRDPSAKTSDVAAHPDVNVSVGDGKGWLSMSGTAKVSRDQARIDNTGTRGPRRTSRAAATIPPSPCSRSMC